MKKYIAIILMLVGCAFGSLDRDIITNDMIGVVVHRSASDNVVTTPGTIDGTDDGAMNYWSGTQMAWSDPLKLHWDDANDLLSATNVTASGLITTAALLLNLADDEQYKFQRDSIGELALSNIDTDAAATQFRIYPPTVSGVSIFSLFSNATPAAGGFTNNVRLVFAQTPTNATINTLHSGDGGGSGATPLTLQVGARTGQLVLNVTGTITASGGGVGQGTAGFTLTSGDIVLANGNIIIPYDAFIGSATKTNAIQVDEHGDVQFIKDITVNAILKVDGNTQLGSDNTVVHTINNAYKLPKNFGPTGHLVTAAGGEGELTYTDPAQTGTGDWGFWHLDSGTRTITTLTAGDNVTLGGNLTLTAGDILIDGGGTNVGLRINQGADDKGIQLFGGTVTPGNLLIRINASGQSIIDASSDTVYKVGGGNVAVFKSSSMDCWQDFRLHPDKGFRIGIDKYTLGYHSSSTDLQLVNGKNLNVDVRMTLNSAGDWKFGTPATDYAQFSAEGDLSFGGGGGFIEGHMTIPGVDIVVDTSGTIDPVEVADDGTGVPDAGDGWASVYQNEVTFAVSDLHYQTVTIAGTYKVIWDQSPRTAAGGGTVIHGGIMIDGVAGRDNGEGHAHIFNANDNIQINGIGIVDCPNGNEEISLWISNNAGFKTLIEHGNMNVQLIGGT